MSCGLRIIDGGFLALVQDRGRIGQFHLGLTTGGPMDEAAFYWAQTLCENPLDSGAIELSVGGLKFEAEINTRMALAGADIPCTINGAVVDNYAVHTLRPGDTVEFGFAQSGLRAYIAVAGGIDLPPMFDSLSTVVREGIGGISGQKLAPGDVLPCVENSPAQPGRILAKEFQPVISKAITLRYIQSYQADSFSVIQKRLFENAQYQVTANIDRMGYRLMGPAIEFSSSNMLSEGICLGAIQIPADGQPIVLMHDRQTIGGYPKIGSVIGIDLRLLAQTGEGSEVLFESVSVNEAQTLTMLETVKRQRITQSLGGGSHDS